MTSVLTQFHIPMRHNSGQDVSLTPAGLSLPC